MLHAEKNSKNPNLNAFRKVKSFGCWVARSEKVILRWLLRKFVLLYREREQEKEEEEGK